MNLYKTNWIESKFKNEEETKVEFYGENEFYDKVTVAKFDFYTNEGVIYQLNGKRKDVKRFSTILNYFEKLNFNCINYYHYEKAKLNAKKIKNEELKNYQNQLKNKCLDKINQFKSSIINNDEKIINICKSMEDKDDDYLKTAIKNTFKYASNKQLNEMFEFIRNYEIHIKVIEESNDQIIEELNEEKSESKFKTFNDKYYYHKKEFNSYGEAFSYVCKFSGKTHLIYINNQILSQEKLHYLEDELIIKKRNMNIDDAILYFKYLESIPNSLDRENTYYKLKNWFNL